MHKKNIYFNFLLCNNNIFIYLTNIGCIPPYKCTKTKISGVLKKVIYKRAVSSP